MLMDAGFMSESIGSHHGLAARNADIRQAADQLGHAADLVRVCLKGAVIVIPARIKVHHHFLKRRITGSLSDAVNRALHIGRPCGNAGQAVGNGISQIVMAMNGKKGFVYIRNIFADRLIKVIIFHRLNISNGYREYSAPPRPR